MLGLAGKGKGGPHLLLVENNFHFSHEIFHISELCEHKIEFCLLIDMNLS